MNVVDSSGWLEYFADAPNAEFSAPAIEDVENLQDSNGRQPHPGNREASQRGALDAYSDVFGHRFRE